MGPPPESESFSPLLAAITSPWDLQRNENVLRWTQWLWNNAAKTSAIATKPKNNATISSGLMTDKCCDDKRQLQFYDVLSEILTFYRHPMNMGAQEKWIVLGQLKLMSQVWTMHCSYMSLCGNFGQDQVIQTLDERACRYQIAMQCQQLIISTKELWIMT